MSPLATRLILGGGLAATAAAAILVLLPSALPAAAAAAALACVASVAQSERLRGGERPVYRPVPVRRQGVVRRVRSDG